MKSKLHLVPPLLAVTAGLALHPLVGGPTPAPAPVHHLAPVVRHVPPRDTHPSHHIALPPPTGPHTFCDSAQPNLCPPWSQAVASYIDGVGGFPVAQHSFPHAFLIAIDVRGNKPWVHGAEALDVEPGGAWPPSVARQWAIDRNRLGYHAVIYCAVAWCGAVRAAVQGTDSVIWISEPNLGHPASIPGSGAVQYFWADHGATFDLDYTPLGVFRLFGKA